MTNNGQIVGYGTFKTGGLTNSGTISLTGGISTVLGNVTNNSGALISVTENTANFTGDVVNNGTFRSMSSVANFEGTFTNNGTFLTDPSTLNFNNLVIGAAGTVTSSAGDTFRHRRRPDQRQHYSRRIQRLAGHVGILRYGGPIPSAEPASSTSARSSSTAAHRSIST